MQYTVKFLQNSFLVFFESKKHTILPGSSPIPHSDPTLLFTNAGMNQFKQYFTGAEIPLHDPVTTAQHCIRAGGKHNDLEQVGFTKRHLTHFTMLGNFSFGVYFKVEAIHYAWEYLTKTLQINPSKLWITVYCDDQEAYNIWHRQIGIQQDKIFKLGEKDNFWQMSDTGPCGPCSEIYYDRGVHSDTDAKSFPSDDKSDRFIEIWNLVFIQFEKHKDGSFLPLTKPGIDTGMGLERLASVLQNKDSVFEIDAFARIIDFIAKQSKISYSKKNASTFHVLCDHIRTSALLIANGVIPGNEGRSYVLRKIIRRALLFSRELSADINFFASLINPLITPTDSLYHDLTPQKDIIYKIIIEESKKFFDTLEEGLIMFQSFLSKQKKKNIFSGKDAFILYDTYGFPLEITKILTDKNNMEVDILQYQEAMEEQKNRSRQNKKFKTNNDGIQYQGTCKTEFIGYHSFILESPIQDIKLSNKDNTMMILFFEQTVFYPGGGGQIPDAGWIKYNDHQYSINKIIKYDEAIGIEIPFHDFFIPGLIVTQEVDYHKRLATAIHHSTVHILHKAINTYFNNSNIYQDGSFVSDQYFSIDMVMNESVDYNDKKNIEMIINNIINQGYPIVERYMSFHQAKQLGATAQFTEKYNPENVRVIDMHPFTMDLCGGCHAENTKQLGVVCLTEVSSIRSGVKRFVGVANQRAMDYIRLLEEAANTVKKQYSCSLENISKTIEKKLENEKSQSKILEIEKQNLAQWITNIILKHNNKNFIIMFFPLFLKGNEKFLGQKCFIQGIHFLITYNEKNIIYAHINPIHQTQYHDQIKNLLAQSGFKGKAREAIFEGAVNTIEYIENWQPI